MSDLNLSIDTADVFVPALNPDLRYIALRGGRGSGKSHFLADTWLDENVREKHDVVCLRETLKSLEFSVKKLLEEKIVKHNAGDYFDVQNYRIFSKQGGVTIFDGMQNHTNDSIKSLENFDRAWFAEAQRASEKSLKLLRPTLRAKNAQMWFDWNPNHPDDPIEKLFNPDEMPPRSILINATYKENPWFYDDTSLVEEMEFDKRRDPDAYAHIWLGEYEQRTEARVFNNWTIEEFERPAGTVFRLGADWGFAVDPTVLIRVSIEGKRLYIDYEAYMVNCDIDQTPDLFSTVPEADKWYITADSSRPETISYLKNHGFPKITGAIKGAGSVADGVEWMKSYDIVVHPRCKHTIDELTLYKYKIDKLTDQVLPVLDDKHNHVIDAVRYACEGMRRALPTRSNQEKRPTRRVINTKRGWMR